MLIALAPTEAKRGLNKSRNFRGFGTPCVLLVVHASDQSQSPSNRFNSRPVFCSRPEILCGRLDQDTTRSTKAA